MHERPRKNEKNSKCEKSETNSANPKRASPKTGNELSIHMSVRVDKRLPMAMWSSEGSEGSERERPKAKSGKPERRKDRGNEEKSK